MTDVANHVARFIAEGDLPLPEVEQPAKPAFDARGVDGRTLRRTFRDRAFATKIKPDAHDDLKQYAFDNGITIAEALERAIALLVKKDKR